MVINQAERKFDSGASIRFAGQYSIHICCKTQPISTQTLWRQIQGLLRFVVCWITGRFAVNYISTSFLNETWNENYSLLISTMNSIKPYSTNMTYELISGYIYILYLHNHALDPSNIRLTSFNLLSHLVHHQMILTKLKLNQTHRWTYFCVIATYLEIWNLKIVQ